MLNADKIVKTIFSRKGAERAKLNIMCYFLGVLGVFA